MPQQLDLSKLSDEDLQIYEDLLKQRQTPQKAAAVPESPAPGGPWVGTSDWRYPLAEGARAGVEGVSNALGGAGKFISNAVQHPLDTIAGFTAPVSSGPKIETTGPNAYQLPPDPLLRALGTIGRNAGALVAPGTVQQATPERNAEAQGFAGETAASAALAKALSAVPTKKILSGEMSAGLDEAAAANKARAMRPTTMQGKADIAQVAPEISQGGLVSGLRQKTIDANVIKARNTAGEKVGAAENRLRANAQPETVTERASLIQEIDAAKAKLNLEGTDVTGRPEAVKQLNDIRGIIEKLPEQIKFGTLIDLRRQLDARAAEAGSFGVNADTLKADINRGVANVVRSKLNDLDTELAKANHEFSVYQKAADVVERRQLSGVGKIESGLPGRGGILDDILAGWAGNAMGGPAGSIAVEALNLGRQTPGWANLKSSMQQRLANSLRPAPPQPRGLLPQQAGAPYPMGMPENSGINVTSPNNLALTLEDYLNYQRTHNTKR